MSELMYVYLFWIFRRSDTSTSILSLNTSCLIILPFRVEKSQESSRITLRCKQQSDPGSFNLDDLRFVVLMHQRLQDVMLPLQMNVIKRQNTNPMQVGKSMAF